MERSAPVVPRGVGSMSRVRWSSGSVTRRTGPWPDRSSARAGRRAGSRSSATPRTHRPSSRGGVRASRWSARTSWLYELAEREDHTAAFAAYESGLRQFVEENQALPHSGLAVLAPRTAEELAARNEALARPTLASGEEGRSVNASLRLRAYSAGVGSPA